MKDLSPEEAEAAMLAILPAVMRKAETYFGIAREMDDPGVLGECVPSDWDAEF